MFLSRNEAKNACSCVTAHSRSIRHSSNAAFSWQCMIAQWSSCSWATPSWDFYLFLSNLARCCLCVLDPWHWAGKMQRQQFLVLWWWRLIGACWCCQGRSEQINQLKARPSDSCVCAVAAVSSNSHFGSGNKLWYQTACMQTLLRHKTV